MGNDLLLGRHFFLYAKGHYRRRDVLEDVRALVADYTAMSSVQVSDNDVVTVLCDIAIPYLLKSADPVRAIRKAICDLVETSRRECKVLDARDVVSAMLVILGWARVREGEEEILHLGEPDFTLLPRPESAYRLMPHQRSF